MDVEFASRCTDGDRTVTRPIHVAAEFKRSLGGRYVTDGPASGEAFRTEILLPRVLEALRNHDVVIVNFDGVAGMPTSFLEEAFGGLIRITPDRDPVEIMDAVSIVAPNSPKLWPFCALAKSYMEKAARRR